MDAIIDKLLEHAPTWLAALAVVLIVLGAIGLQSFKLVQWMTAAFKRIEDRLDKQDKREDEHESILVDSGIAAIEEKTDGSRRLVTVLRLDGAPAPYANGHLK